MPFLLRVILCALLSAFAAVSNTAAAEPGARVPRAVSFELQPGEAQILLEPRLRELYAEFGNEWKRDPALDTFDEFRSAFYAANGTQYEPKLRDRYFVSKPGAEYALPRIAPRSAASPQRDVPEPETTARTPTPLRMAPDPAPRAPEYERLAYRVSLLEQGADRAEARIGALGSKLEETASGLEARINSVRGEAGAAVGALGEAVTKITDAVASLTDSSVKTVERVGDLEQNAQEVREDFSAVIGTTLRYALPAAVLLLGLVLVMALLRRRRGRIDARAPMASANPDVHAEAADARLPIHWDPRNLTAAQIRALEPDNSFFYRFTYKGTTYPLECTIADKRESDVRIRVNGLPVRGRDPNPAELKKVVADALRNGWLPPLPERKAA